MWGFRGCFSVIRNTALAWVVDTALMAIARLSLVVLDCPDPWSLAPFYERLTGMKKTQEGATYVVIGDSLDNGIGFQKVENYRRPRWPDPVFPQQSHLDLEVDDLAAAHDQALAIGATLLHDGAPRFQVFADPVGHPFCLCAS